MNLEEFKYGGTNVTAFRMVTITKMTRNIIDYDDDDIFIDDQNDYYDESFGDIFIGDVIVVYLMTYFMTKYTTG